MAYRAKNLDSAPGANYQVTEIPVHGMAKSLQPGSMMLNHTQHTGMPVNAMGKEYTTIQDSHIQNVTTLSMVSTLVPTQPIASVHGAAMNSVSMPVTSEPLHLIIKSPKVEEGQHDQERRLRREIANSNERRRMQSINAGFKSLKTILPHTDGEKLSKAAILQQTSEYITQLESDKLKLMHQNEKLRRAYADCKCNSPKHRALVCDIFDKDEGIGSPAEEDFEDMRRGIIEVRHQLDKERRMRMLYEDRIRSLEAQIYPDKLQRLKSAPPHRTSSDEPQSSSEYSPSAAYQEPLDSGKLLTCARPLLPPLTPLQSKVTAPDQAARRLSQLDSPGHIFSTALYTVSEARNEFQNDVLSAGAVSSLTAPNKRSVSLDDTAPMRQRVAFTKQDAAPDARQGHSVTVFSHSTRSNQPLKKRAIEIHQNFTEAPDQGSEQQPVCKVAKITSDPIPEIGTRSFLPPTLPPISLGTLKLQSPTVRPLALPQLREPTTSRASKGNMSLHPHVVATVPTSFAISPVPGHPLVSATSLPYQPVLQAKLKTPNDPSHSGTGTTKIAFTSLPMQTVITSPCMSAPQAQMSMAHSAPIHIEGIRSFLPHSPVTEQEVTLPKMPPAAYAVEGVKSASHRDTAALPSTGVTGPTHVPVTNVQHEVQYDTPQQPENPGPESLAVSASKRSRLVVAHQSPGTVLLNAALPLRDESKGAKSLNLCMVYQQQQPACTAVVQEMDPDLAQSTAFTMAARNDRNGAPRIAAVPCGPLQVTSSMQAHAFQCSSLPRLQNSLQKIQGAVVHPQISQTVLCYRPPEITLNQLNAVPNLLPPPRSLHQPLILSAAPSLAQNLSGSSPSYVSPALQDPVTALPARYQNFTEVRRRKSSMSATDSCSTASISGAEEEEMKNPLLDDPDCQSEDSVPTIKLCNSMESPASPRKAPSQSDDSEPPPGVVAAYNEVPQDSVESAPIDVPDKGSRSPSTTKNTTLSVLSGVAGSPPVIRRIDAIQTRRNLETIVQAIDHLEQQERRNSQDHCSAPATGE